MTRTLNSDSYAILLSKYQPKIIETETENEAAIARLEELEHKSDNRNKLYRKLAATRSHNKYYI